jgi:hypothetical protein
MLTDEEIKIIYDEYECEMDAGHTVNGFARAIERAVLKKLEEQEAVFYYRPTSSGGYEGPKWAESMEKCRIDSGVWRPLYAHPLPAQSVPEGWQLVPIEPTEDQIDSVGAAYHGHGLVQYARGVYLTMLSATPKP